MLFGMLAIICSVIFLFRFFDGITEPSIGGPKKIDFFIALGIIIFTCLYLMSKQGGHFSLAIEV